ncbi:hypothetical protein DINM_001672 [Dirofilaria immitis]|nr:hypothetical protein [Dirofilaria immitis]
MRLYLAIDVLLLLVLRIKSNRIILHRFSLFIQQHCCNNISQIHRLNDCKYSKVRMKIDKKILIIVSKTEWCNEAIKVVFGKSAEARRNRSDAISWVTPYNFTGLMNLHSKWRYDAYFDNVTRTAHGLARIDLLCPKRRSHSGRRILKRSIQENKQEKSRRSFTVHNTSVIPEVSRIFVNVKNVTCKQYNEQILFLKQIICFSDISSTFR